MLVNELQESAEKDDAITVLRRTKRLCAKLGRKDILEWVNNEVNGYRDNSEIPAYRNITSYHGYYFNCITPPHITGQYLIKGFQHNGCSDKRFMLQPISEVISIIEHLPYRETYVEEENEIKLNNAVYILQYNDDEIKAIPERIKDTILDWACNLESAGVIGKNKTFNEKEKNTAHSVVFNISNSSVGNISESGTNLLKKE